MKQAITLLLSGFVYQVSAQNTIPNPGFEAWENGGTFFNGYQNPVGWGTLNSATSLLGFETVKRVTNPQFVHSGNAALKLETFFINLLNRPAQGICVTGNINIDTEQVEGGVPYNLRPDNFSGWFQYFPIGSDTGQVAAVLTKWNLLLQQRDTVGIAGKWFLDQTNTYQQFHEPFDYWSDENPDTLMIILVSSSQFEPSIGSVMYIDDLSLNFSTPVQKLSEFGSSSVYPNPASDFFSFDFHKDATFRIYNLKGTLVLNGKVNAGNNKIMVNNWPESIYVITILDENLKPIANDRIIVTR